MFGDHPARNLPIGNRDSIDRSTREVLVSFRDTYFVAGNMAVAVVGDVKHDEIFGDWRGVHRHADRPMPPKNTAPVPPLVRRTQTDTSPASRPGSSSAARPLATTAPIATSWT